DNVVRAVAERSKVITLTEVATATQPAKGTVALTAPPPVPAVPERIVPEDYTGDVSDRSGLGGLEAVDEVTMVCVPDLMSAYQRGVLDLEAVKAVQLAVIAHCELMGDRVAVLDTPPGLSPQQVKDWRVDYAGYDSKYAALY
ncbi:tail protein, partial [Thermoactinomyces vulgaris]